MAIVSRVPIVWSGAPVVGGGFSVLHCNPGDEHALMDAFRTFLDTCKTSFPTGLQWTFPGTGTQLTVENGDVSGTWNDASPPAALAAAGAGTWVNGVGVRIKWATGEVHGTNLVTGATFLVPLLASVYEGAGNITDGTITFFNVAANTLLSTGLLIIYARPRPGLDGAIFPAEGVTVPDRVSWLRGRRT